MDYATTNKLVDYSDSEDEEQPETLHAVADPATNSPTGPTVHDNPTRAASDKTATSEQLAAPHALHGLPLQDKTNAQHGQNELHQPDAPADGSALAVGNAAESIAAEDQAR